MIVNGNFALHGMHRGNTLPYVQAQTRAKRGTDMNVWPREAQI